MQRLSQGEVHLWFAAPGETGDPLESDDVDPVLGPREKERLKRLRSPAGRRLFAVSHTLVRTALSRYAGIRPGEWRFADNAHGKPLIDPSIGSPPLSFSLAHTQGLAAVAATRGEDIGVDLEREDRRVDAERVIGRFFSPGEAAALRGLPHERRRKLFFLYWTLKEAYVKARGLGLMLPLDSFAFRLEGPIPFRIGFSAIPPEAPDEWRFALFRPLPHYAAAVCVRTHRSDPLSIRCFQALPSGKTSVLSAEFLGGSTGVGMDDGEG